MNNNGIDKEFIDEKGLKSTMHIEPMNDAKVNLKLGKYKLANFSKKEQNVKKNIFTRDLSFKKLNNNGLFTKDIGLKSNGFAQVASLAFIVAVATLLIAYVLLRY